MSAMLTRKGVDSVKYKMLIVDDEADIVSMLRDYFEFHGYTVFAAYNGVEAIQATAQEPDIILLDINMPVMNGLDVCKTIRQHISCPIIFLTARVEENDAIEGFQSGADDYVVKPFKVNELGARVAAHLRRDNRNTSVPVPKFIGGLVINYSEKQVSYEGALISFTKKQFEIIELLTRNIGQVFDKERIYELLWGYDSEGTSTVVVEHIRRIRDKLKEVTGREYVETVWGVGYKWAKT